MKKMFKRYTVFITFTKSRLVKRREKRRRRKKTAPAHLTFFSHIYTYIYKPSVKKVNFSSAKLQEPIYRKIK